MHLVRGRPATTLDHRGALVEQIAGVDLRLDQFANFLEYDDDSEHPPAVGLERAAREPRATVGWPLLEVRNPVSSIAVTVPTVAVFAVVVALPVYLNHLGYRLVARFQELIRARFDRKSPAEKAKVLARAKARLERDLPPPDEEDAVRAEIEAVFPGATTPPEGEQARHSV